MLFVENYAFPFNRSYHHSHRPVLHSGFNRTLWTLWGAALCPRRSIIPLSELNEAYKEAQADPEFRRELNSLLKTFAGRPTELYLAERLTEHFGGAKIYLKREDLLHTGAHKINNALGQALLAKRMGKKRIIAETGAGQHGIATAAVCAKFGLECKIYMGAEDMRRQALNVFRMRQAVLKCMVWKQVAKP